MLHSDIYWQLEASLPQRRSNRRCLDLSQTPWWRAVSVWYILIMRLPLLNYLEFRYKIQLVNCVLAKSLKLNDMQDMKPNTPIMLNIIAQTAATIVTYRGNGLKSPSSEAISKIVSFAAKCPIFLSECAGPSSFAFFEKSKITVIHVLQKIRKLFQKIRFILRS